MMTATRHVVSDKGELSDGQLLQQACGGEPLAFETLVHRYQRLLYRFAYRLLGGEQAQDVVQRVLLQLYLTMPRLRESHEKNPSLKAWLLRVTHNCCVDELRRKKRSLSLFPILTVDEEKEGVSLLETLLDPELLPEEQVEEQERSLQLSAAIEALPPPYRAVVQLRYEEELTFAAIGRRLNMNPATAKTYFHRACRKLRTLLSSGQERAATGTGRRASAHANHVVADRARYA